jgi:tyrosyl-tRNA synthetase
MILKKRLAREIIMQLHNRKVAEAAEGHFNRVFQKRELPQEIAEYRVSFSTPNNIREILVQTNLADSASEATRLITQGAVKIDGIKVSNKSDPVRSGNIISVGRRRFAKVIDSDRLGK